MAAATAMAMATNLQIRGKGGPLSEAASGTMADASPELRWLIERLSGGKGLVSSQGQRGLTISYA